MPRAAPTRSDASSTLMFRLPVRSNFMLRGNRGTRPSGRNQVVIDSLDVHYSLLSPLAEQPGGGPWHSLWKGVADLIGIDPNNAPGGSR